MKVELINGTMKVETSVNEILKRVSTFAKDEDRVGMDYLCPFIGSMGLARLRRKSFVGIIEKHTNDLIDVCNRNQAAEMCMKLLTNAGASQKYMASYRRYLREHEFTVSAQNVVTAHGQYHAILDDDVGYSDSNYTTYQNFRARIIKLGREHNQNFVHDNFRLGILMENVARGHGDDPIVMSYNISELHNCD